MQSLFIKPSHYAPDSQLVKVPHRLPSRPRVRTCRPPPPPLRKRFPRFRHRHAPSDIFDALFPYRCLSTPNPPPPIETIPRNRTPHTFSLRSESHENATPCRRSRSRSRSTIAFHRLRIRPEPRLPLPNYASCAINATQCPPRFGPLLLLLWVTTRECRPPPRYRCPRKTLRYFPRLRRISQLFSRPPRCTSISPQGNAAYHGHTSRPPISCSPPPPSVAARDPETPLPIG